MGIPLRGVVGAAVALFVLVLAAATIGITYAAGVAAMRGVGEPFASTLGDGIAREQHALFDQHTAMLQQGAAMARLPGWGIPGNDTAMADRWLDMLHGMQLHQRFRLRWCVAYFADNAWAVAFNSTAVPLRAVVYSPAANGTLHGVYYDPADMAAVPRPQWPAADLFRSHDSRAVFGILNSSVLGGVTTVFVPPAPIATPSGMTFNFLLLSILRRHGAVIGGLLLGVEAATLGATLRRSRATASMELFILSRPIPGTSPVPLGVLASTHPAVRVTTLLPGQDGSGVACVGNLLQPGVVAPPGCVPRPEAVPYPPLQKAASASDFFDSPQRTVEAGGRYYLGHADLTPSVGFTMWQLRLVLFLPESDIDGPLVRGISISIAAAGAFALVAIIVALGGVYLVLSPLRGLAHRMEQAAILEGADDGAAVDDFAATTRRTETGPGFATPDDDMVSTAVSAASVPTAPGSGTEAPVRSSRGLIPGILARMPRAAKLETTELARVASAVGSVEDTVRSVMRYTSAAALRELERSGRLGSVELLPRPCAVVFVELGDTTTRLVPDLTPALLSTTLHSYFAHVFRCIAAHGGTVDTLAGDRVLATWGAPHSVDSPELRAALCALSLAAVVSPELGAVFAEVNEACRLRIGAGAGDVVAGTIGCDHRKAYTVLGPEVRAAAHLAALNTQWGTTALFTGALAAAVAPWVCTRHVASCDDGGGPLRVHEPLGVLPVAPPADPATPLSARPTTTPPLSALAAVALETCGASVEAQCWATVHGAAVAAFECGDFAACAEHLSQLDEDAEAPLHAFAHRSTQYLLRVADGMLQCPTVRGFTGLWPLRLPPDSFDAVAHFGGSRAQGLMELDL